MNEEENLTNCVIGSMDVKALYPSIDIDFAVERCVELLKDSDINFENVDSDELGLYISLMTNIEQRKEEGIEEMCPTRKNKGKNPTITGCGSYTDYERRWSFHNKAKKGINDPNILKNIISYAVGITLKVTLKNHIFTFNSKIYKQTKGGAIGVGIAGDVANLFMVWWDRRMRAAVINRGIDMKLYSRYVDDTNLVVKAVNADETENKEEKTMLILQDIANAIHPSIQVTVDFPSNHENGRMPILDTEQWIENIKVGDRVKPQILHSQYSKPMSSKYVTHHDSAMPYQTKINILIADLVRIMRNVSSHCQENERRNKIQEYLLRLQHSGYNKVERNKIYIKAKKKYNLIVENDKNKICPMYRSKFWKQKERRRQKENKIRTWYNDNGKYDTVLFVDHTENSDLARKCQKVINEIGLKIKVQEKSGVTLKQDLVRSNPFQKLKCLDQCTICESHPKINCKMRDVIYDIVCEGDHGAETIVNYGGETSRSIGERFNEHLEDILKKKTNAPMYQHFSEMHNSITQPISLKVIKSYPFNAMLRQATEAVYIKENKPVLNAKMEFGNMNVVNNPNANNRV